MLRDLLDWKVAFLTSPQGNAAALSIADTVLRFIKIKFELFIDSCYRMVEEKVSSPCIARHALRNITLIVITFMQIAGHTFSA